MLFNVSRCCALVIAFACASVLGTAAAHAAPVNAPGSPSAAALTVAASPTVAPCSVVVAATGKEKTGEEKSEANLYSVITTAIWALMWIVIALVAKAAFEKAVSGERPKQL